MNRRVAAFFAASLLLITAAGAVMVINLSDSGSDIRIACGTKNCYEPIWIADRYGMFSQEDVNAELLYVDGGGSAATSILDGTSDMTIVGADPAVRMLESGSGHVLGVMQMPGGSGGLEEFAYRSGMGIDLADASTLLNPDGTVRVLCGIDVTTGYYSGYISYLYGQMESGSISEEQYTVLREKGIVHVEAHNQVAALIGGDVQMICGGNTVTVAAGHPGIEAGCSPEGSVIGTCYIICSERAYSEKHGSIVKALTALDRACRFIEDPATARQAAEYCAWYYGAEGWTADAQERFFSGYYWDVCICKGMSGMLEFTADVLGYAERDYSDRMRTDALVQAHENIDYYDHRYLYDPEQGGLVDA